MVSEVMREVDGWERLIELCLSRKISVEIVVAVLLVCAVDRRFGEITTMSDAEQAELERALSTFWEGWLET